MARPVEPELKTADAREEPDGVHPRRWRLGGGRVRVGSAVGDEAEQRRVGRLLHDGRGPRLGWRGA